MSSFLMVIYQLHSLSLTFIEFEKHKTFSDSGHFLESGIIEVALPYKVKNNSSQIVLAKLAAYARAFLNL